MSVGDYWEIMTGGYFTADASVPEPESVMTGGWWDAAGAAIAAAAAFMAAIIHHQHMNMGGLSAGGRG